MQPFSIHRLVQEVVREQCRKQGGRRGQLQSLVNCLWQVLPYHCSMWGMCSEGTRADDTFVIHTELYPHVKTAVDHAHKVSIESEAMFVLYDFIGETLRDRHRHADAIAQGFLKAKALGVNLFKDKMTGDRACVEIHLAESYKECKSYREALETLGKLEEYARSVMDEDCGELLAYITRDKGRIYEEQKAFARARDAYLEALP